MYTTLNSFVIAAVVLLLLLVAVEVGYRMGFRRSSSFSDAKKAHISSISGSLWGMLALLLGFTFSLSIQRFDSRSDAVVNEANALGTAYLRTSLLDPDLRDAARIHLHEYITIRIADGSTSLADHGMRQQHADREMVLKGLLWDLVTTAAQRDGQGQRLALFVQSVNEVFDALDTREAALNRHVPGLVLSALLLTVLLSGAVMGYAAGASAHRVSLAGHLMNAILIIVVFIISDLDRPRRGFVQVDQHPMTSLRSLIDPAGNSASP